MLIIYVLLTFLLKLFLKDRTAHCIFINPVTENEIIDITNYFKTGKGAGFDGVNMADVKDNRTAISKSLSYLINLSISSGIVPDNIG